MWGAHNDYENVPGNKGDELLLHPTDGLMGVDEKSLAMWYVLFMDNMGGYDDDIDPCPCCVL